MDLSFDSILELLVVFTIKYLPIVLFIIGLIVAIVGQKYTDKYQKLQRQGTYISYVCIPEKLPVKMFTHRKMYFKLSIQFFLITCGADAVFYHLYGQKTIMPLVIINAVVLFAIFFMIIEYYRNDNYRSHYILTEKSVIYMERCATFFDNFEIPYNEIMSIMYICTNETYEKYVLKYKRGLVKEKDIRHFHYIIIQSHNQRIVIDTSSIKGKDLWKIINTCLYFNPNIIVDGFVKSILIHKKVPLFFNLKTDNQREYENLTRYK